ncbi:alpha-1A adrenergic receptor-like [Lampris incognitus]|uniref:alpha-1A adrenergic receptor-like n=1 Tax=Lampris incognitus TaxID=2546036 RepID=UPI0024B6222F|nr:alpha-1A adrenergic receptor-like [Lampris incognitus]
MVPTGENINSSSLMESCPNCSSSAYPSVNVIKAVTLGVVLGVIIIFGILGNILVILSVVCHRHLRSVTHYFIVNLAAADLLLTSAVLPFSATFEVLGRWVFGRTFCNAWAALDVLCCTASILTLCVISVDRCLAVTYPLRYTSMATERRGMVTLVSLWILSAVISVGPLFGWKEPDPEDETVCRITEEPGYALFSAFGSFYIPLAVILFMYCRVYVVAKRKMRGLSEGKNKEGLESEGVMLRIHRGNAAVADKQDDAGEDKVMRSRRTMLMTLLKISKEKKAAKTLGIVVGCFVLCWLPFFLVLPIGSIFPSCKPSETVFKITFWLGYFNSCINPIIYPCFSQEFKKAFQNVICGRCLKCRQPPKSPSSSHSVSSVIKRGSPSTPHKPSTLSTRSHITACCCCSCSNLSVSSSSLGPPDHAQNTRFQSKSLLKAWCFTKRDTSLPQERTGHDTPKILHLSLGVKGEVV